MKGAEMKLVLRSIQKQLFTVEIIIRPRANYDNKSEGAFPRNTKIFNKKQML